MLNWARPFNIFCLLDNRHYNFENPAFECMLAAGCKRNIQGQAHGAFDIIQQFYSEKKDWVFGHLSYDLKNDTENLSSANYDGVGFPDYHFFVPEYVFQLNANEITIFCEGDAEAVFEAVKSQSPIVLQTTSNNFQINNRISSQDYKDIIKKIQQHVLRGDCYEINFCQEFFAANAVIDPLAIYCALVEISPNPFCALYKLNGRYCICASPERYFKKVGTKIFSQPIKGTAKRNLQDSALDTLSRQQLCNSEKEKSENVMVVDLVRNDLSRVCKEGTVKVDELFGVYSFPQVHQLVSTISGELKDGVEWIDIIKASFPMGSMTGAPKKRVMEIIERYEYTRRGLFSGSIGYVTPAGDADFNVVIRSILYNAPSKYLSFQTGGAITFYSDAEAEYEECLLKAEAIKQVLKNRN